MKPNIGIIDKDREGVGKVLMAPLADEYERYTKTRNYHWNVAEPQFSNLHKFFESQHKEPDDNVDEVAERARAVGVIAIGTLQALTPTCEGEGASCPLSGLSRDDCRSSR